MEMNRILTYLLYATLACILVVTACQLAMADDQEVKLYYFSIDNCYFCTLQTPLIVQLKANGFNFEIINATYPTPRVQVLLDRYAITKYPTIIIAKADGSVIRIVGFRPLKVIRGALK